MEFVGMELAVAAYVFGKDLPKSEVLVPTEHCLEDRRALHTLCPGERVMDNQIAVNPTNYCPSTQEYIKRKFMGKADQLFKLVYLDSLKDSKLTKSRKDQMLYVAFFLENLLCDDFFYEGTPNEMHKPSTYEIVEPEIGQQVDGSNDCGVWVTQWMIQSHLWSNYDLPVVNEHTRMRLVVDIVLGRHNPYRVEIGRRAVEYWDKRCRKLARKTKKMTGQLDVTTSPTI
ncbi:hypothetical protein AHAS_Ahas20G0214700 [Arachis hypogaea]